MCINVNLFLYSLGLHDVGCRYSTTHFEARDLRDPVHASADVHEGSPSPRAVRD